MKGLNPPSGYLTLSKLLIISSNLLIETSGISLGKGGKLSGLTVEVDEEELEEVGDIALSISQPCRALVFKDSKEGDVRLEGPATGGSLK
jgi:hypothetical protein